MDYDKLIADAAAKLNGLVNEIIDACDKEGTPVNPGTIISDLTARAFPEEDGVTQVDKPEDEEPIGTLPKDDNRPMWVGKDGQVHIGEPGEEYTKQYGELDPHIRKALDDFASNNSHFGEGQAEGLDNLLEGLKDTPHDNRW